MSKDENKRLALVRRAMIDLTVEKGYNDVSIRKIAKKAGVSTGYLYRYYDGKLDLIADIMNTEFDAFESIFEKILRVHINSLFDKMKEDEYLIKFLMIIIFDLNITKMVQESNKFCIKDRRLILKGIYEKGIKDKVINPEKISLTLFITIFLKLPFSHVMELLRFKSLGFIEEKDVFSEKERKALVQVCLDALK